MVWSARSGTRGYANGAGRQRERVRLRFLRDLVRNGRSRGQGHLGRHAAAVRITPGGLEITALEPARITAVADLAGERLLATSIQQDGGWRLLIDGEPHPAILANGPLVAAWLPAGRHRLELLYRPESFRTGMLLAALSLSLLLAWAGRPR